MTLAGYTIYVIYVIYLCLGEMNAPAIINVSTLSTEERAIYDAGWKRAGYNLYAGDKISVRRKMPDFREIV